MKFPKDIKRNILFVTIGSIILCALLLLVFVIIGQFNLSVLLGAILGTAITIGNFILLAWSLQKAVDKPESGKGIAGVSYLLRNVLLLVLAILAIVLLKVNVIALLVPYIFPRIVILFLQITGKYQNNSPSEIKEVEP